ALRNIEGVAGIGLFALVVVLVSAAVIAMRKAIEVIIVLCVVGVLVALMLPATQKVREAASRTQAANDLRQLGLGIANYQDAHGTLPGQGSTAEPVRIRELFPETLLWHPEIITDEAGNASLDIDLADSITTWRLTGSAVTGDGKFGAVEASIRVFQPFF